MIPNPVKSGKNMPRLDTFIPFFTREFQRAGKRDLITGYWMVVNTW